MKRISPHKKKVIIASMLIHVIKNMFIHAKVQIILLLVHKTFLLNNLVELIVQILPFSYSN